MAEYLHLFETEEEFQEARSENYKEPWVSVTVENNNRVDYNKSEYEKLLATPLTFEITSGGNIAWTAQNAAFTRTIEYKKNNGEWTSITSATGNTAPIISVVSGDTVQFRGDNAAYSSGGSRYNRFVTTDCEFNVKGNIMSLINSTNFTGADTLESANTFLCLFFYCRGINGADELILPATTLKTSCYERMFQGCTGLTQGPALPATTLTESCYRSMFFGCTNLTTAPSTLPATTLASNCYTYMFYGCTSLVQGPSSIGTSATTMANSACCNMFSACTSLTTAPELPATTLASYCYQYMFADCASLTSAPELPATTLAEYCYEGMFNYCVSLTSAPELPVTTLANNCYGSMFYGCASLTSAPELPATTLAEYCYPHMFNGCTSLTQAPELPAAILLTGCYQGMFQGCTNLNYIKCLATDISANSCLGNWVSDVASSGTFVKAASMTDWPTGVVYGIPANWTVQDA